MRPFGMVRRLCFGSKSLILKAEEMEWSEGWEMRSKGISSRGPPFFTLPVRDEEAMWSNGISSEMDWCSTAVAKLRRVAALGAASFEVRGDGSVARDVIDREACARGCLCLLYTGDTHGRINWCAVALCVLIAEVLSLVLRVATLESIVKSIRAREQWALGHET
mgnify:CR=1 FL=1